MNIDTVMAIQIVFWGIVLAYGAATVWSVVAFLSDLSSAKKEGRKVKTGLKAFFITMMTLNAIVVAIFALIFVIAITGMSGM